jgi:hypothetical protein
MRATSRAASAVRIQKGLKGSRSAPGVLHHKHVHARLVRDAPFRGRVALDRGVGVVEFPTLDQFRRIAREEGVPSEAVDRAFGAKPRAERTTSRGRRRSSRHRKTSHSAPRRSSRKGGVLARIFGLTPNTQKVVRRDRLMVASKLDGTPIPMSARSVLIADTEVARFGSTHGVQLNLGGQIVILPYQEAVRFAQPWASSRDFYRAFGHLKAKGVLGHTPRQSIPTAYGPRSMKLGHFSEGVQETDRGPIAKGDVRPGIAKGQLVLFHKPTGSVVWMAFDDEPRNPKKPILIRLAHQDGSGGYAQKNFAVNKAFTGAKIGTGDKAEMVGAVDRGIPPMAMLTAFDHLLTREQRRQAYEMFSKPGPPPEE